MHFRKGDMVEVTTGDDAGNIQAPTVGKVLRVLLDANKVVVEGVNRVYKHLRPSRANPQGGRLSKEMPVGVKRAAVLLLVPPRGARRPALYQRGGQGTLLQEMWIGLGAAHQTQSQIRQEITLKTDENHGPASGTLHEKRCARIIQEIRPRQRAEPAQTPKDRLEHGRRQSVQDKNRMEQAVEQLTQIAGQKAVITKAKTAVSGFRLRQGNEIGCRVTLRGKRMYEFLDRLIHVALPRIRDFRGINPKSFDGHGNYSMGVSEQMIFPEIDADKVTFTQGMDITFVTSSRNDDEARELLRAFGLPFRES